MKIIQNYNIIRQCRFQKVVSKGNHLYILIEKHEKNVVDLNFKLENIGKIEEIFEKDGKYFFSYRLEIIEYNEKTFEILKNGMLGFLETIEYLKKEGLYLQNVNHENICYTKRGFVLVGIENQLKHTVDDNWEKSIISQIFFSILSFHFGTDLSKMEIFLKFWKTEKIFDKFIFVLLELLRNEDKLNISDVIDFFKKEKKQIDTVVEIEFKESSIKKREIEQLNKNSKIQKIEKEYEDVNFENETIKNIVQNSTNNVNIIVLSKNKLSKDLENTKEFAINGKKGNYKNMPKKMFEEKLMEAFKCLKFLFFDLSENYDYKLKDSFLFVEKILLINKCTNFIIIHDFNVRLDIELGVSLKQILNRFNSLTNVLMVSPFTHIFEEVILPFSLSNDSKFTIVSFGDSENYKILTSDKEMLYFNHKESTYSLIYFLKYLVMLWAVETHMTPSEIKNFINKFETEIDHNKMCRRSIDTKKIVDYVNMTHMNSNIDLKIKEPTYNHVINSIKIKFKINTEFFSLIIDTIDKYKKFDFFDMIKFIDLNVEFKIKKKIHKLNFLINNTDSEDPKNLYVLNEDQFEKLDIKEEKQNFEVIITNHQININLNEKEIYSYSNTFDIRYFGDHVYIKKKDAYSYFEDFMVEIDEKVLEDEKTNLSCIQSTKIKYKLSVAVFFIVNKFGKVTTMFNT